MRASWIVVVIVGGLITGGAASTTQFDASKSGWISDEDCAAEHAKPGRADCVEKCWRGGASMGHPEWKPQRAVFVADDKGVIWIVENSEAVKNFSAAHVLVKGQFDSTKKIVHIQKISALKENSKSGRPHTDDSRNAACRE